MLKPEFRFSFSVLRYSTLYIGIGSHAVAMFAHKKNYGRAGYVDDPLPNIACMAIWMPAWLYYASSSTMWWFSDHFFLLSVCGLLEKN